MPPKITHEQIVDYWASHVSECELGIDWSEAEERCWRCGYKSKLQICHIIPDSLNGKYEPENLVLLCGRCHREAPNFNDPRFMWFWLKGTHASFYDMYWTIRGAREFEEMFGRRPFGGIETGDYNEEDLKKLVQEEINNATIHFGEGRLNPSTIACIFAKVEERITGKDVLIKPKN